jgi:acetyl esterase/lipase
MPFLSRQARISCVLRRLILVLLLFALPACSSLRALDALTPDGRYIVTDGLAYGPLPRQKLDVYTPLGPGPHPVIVFIYGGGWESGERGLYRFVAENLTRHGYAVIIPDYRVYPAARFPVFIEDAALAMRWVRDNAAIYGGDLARLFVMGHSAGAHIGAMLALDGRYLAAVGMTRQELKGFIGLAGPYDFLPLTSARLRTILAASDMTQTQPITFADAGAPPMLLLHGLDDTTVRPANTIDLAAKLTAKGARVETRLYPDMAHVGILLGLSSMAAGDRPVLDEVLTYLDREAPH